MGVPVLVLVGFVGRDVVGLGLQCMAVNPLFVENDTVNEIENKTERQTKADTTHNESVSRRTNSRSLRRWWYWRNASI